MEASDIEKKVTARKAQERAKRNSKKNKIIDNNIENKVENHAEHKKISQDILSEIQRRMDNLHTDEILGYFYENTLGDAKLFKYLFEDIITYVRYKDTYLIWRGHHWAVDDYFHAQALIETLCTLYLRLADSLKERLSDKNGKENENLDKDTANALRTQIQNIERRVNTMRTPKGGDNILSMSQRIHDPLMVLPESFDKKPYLLACPNGVIDLRTGGLLKGNPKDYILQHCHTNYNENLVNEECPCPTVEAFLMRSMDNDAEMVNFLWRLLGYGLIRDRKDHKFIIFWGEHGRNGKDTLMKLITKTLGNDLSSDIPVEMFLQSAVAKNASQASPDVLDLQGCCFAWINEAEENQRFAASKLKKYTGGGIISARGLYEKRSVSWEQTHLPILSTNELPKAKADDAAFWQRVLIVKWQLSFVEEPDPEITYQRQADKYLDEALEKEKEGLLVRLVRGGMEYLRDGLNPPKKVKEWTDDKRDDWDDIGQFLSECCILEPHYDDPSEYKTRTSTSDLHEYYLIWYAKNKDSREKGKISMKYFNNLLQKKNLQSIRSDGTKWLGVTLNEKSIEHRDEVRETRGISKKIS